MATADEKALFAEIGAARKVYIVARDETVALKKEGKAEEANQVLEQKFTPSATLYSAKLEALLDGLR